MQELSGTKVVDVGLVGIILSDNRPINCEVRYISEDCGAIVIATQDPRISRVDELELHILLPTERSPIKCNGAIVRHSKDDGLFKVKDGYVERIFVTKISRIDMRRLELFVTQKQVVP